jgi:L-iditol 2-dehydrogenase
MPMQVARLYDFGDIRLEQMARPQPGSEDLLVKVTACGICSGDIMPWYIRRKAPLVLGHEPVGIVEETGTEVRNFRPGERVFVHHHAPCFICRFCQKGEYVQCATWRSSQIIPGGMAEYFLVRPTNQKDTLKLPNDIDDLDAVLIEPTACVIKSLRRSGLRRGDSVLIVGLGIMGMLHIKLAHHLGAGVIIAADLVEQRVRLAQQLGATHGIVVVGDNLAEEVREITKGEMADVVIVGPGSKNALSMGIAAAGKAATVVQFTATPPDEELVVRPHDLYFKEVKLVPSYSCGPDDTQQALEMVRQRVVNGQQLITHCFPLTQIREAYKQAQNPESLKVVVTFV